MKKTGSQATKAALKNLPKLKKKKANKSKRGGARPGAGRKPKAGTFQQLHIDTPIEIIEAMDAARITNRTALVNYLLAEDLRNRVVISKMPLRKKLADISAALKDQSTK